MDGKALMSMAFSPDGRLVAGAGGATTADDGPSEVDVLVWDVATGAVKYRLGGHEMMVFRVAFSPDGKRIVTAGLPGGLRVWDAATGALERVIRVDPLNLLAMTFHPDGRLVTGGKDGVRLWDVVKGAEVGRIRQRTSVRCLGLSPDGGLLAVGLTDDRERPGEVRVYETATMKEKYLLKGHASTVWSVQLTPDGRRLFSAGGLPGLASEVKVWDVRTGLELVTLPSRRLMVVGLAFSEDGRYMITAGGTAGRGDVALWDCGEALVKPPVRRKD
jgi:tricorn protease-like protein